MVRTTGRCGAHRRQVRSAVDRLGRYDGHMVLTCLGQPGARLAGLGRSKVMRPGRGAGAQS